MDFGDYASLCGSRLKIMNALFDGFKKVLAVIAVVLVISGCGGNVFLPDMERNPWQVMVLSTSGSFSDIAFTDNGRRGWLVGSRNSLFETEDGGENWVPRILDLGEQSYTFTSVDFAGDEGWITGIPNILLHTSDGGDTWENIPLSEKLPGKPFLISALGSNAAEMATDVGAIYVTRDRGSTWKAMVEGAVGVVRNMTRSEDGRYVAVSSRGNFYSTWAPGQQQWQPHNRESSRRLQNMGFDKEGKLWLIARGGQLRFANSRGAEDFSEAISPELATSWGLLDMAYRTPDELWVTGGGGNLLFSPDNGSTWFRDRAVENVPSNFYRIKFIGDDLGFILGQEGVLLSYRAEANSA